MYIVLYTQANTLSSHSAESAAELSPRLCSLLPLRPARHQLILQPDQLTKGPLILRAGGGAAECVSAVALTPLHLLNTNFSPPVPAAVSRGARTFSLIHTNGGFTLLCMHSLTSHTPRERAWRPIMTLQVQTQVTRSWKMFNHSFLDFSGFFSSHSLHLEITRIKSSGSDVEFESLYFPPDRRILPELSQL